MPLNTTDVESPGARCRTFDDPHCATRELRGVEVALVVASGGPRAWKLGEADLGPGGIVQRCETGAMVITGRLRSDMCTLVVPSVDSAETLSIDGQCMRVGTLAFLSGGWRLLMNARGPATWIAVRLPRSEWRKHFPLRTAATHAMHTLEIGSDRHRRLQAWLDQALVRAVRKPVSPQGRAAFRRSVMQTLRSHLDDIPPSGRWRSRGLARDLAEYLASHQREPLFVRDLCAALTTQERALRLAFSSLFGMSPARFLRLRRLNAARRDLGNRQQPAASVTEVGVRYAFFDLGRFASDYRKAFGELPSETLARSRAQGVSPPRSSGRG
jgi:AraC-like DNA-binding protein